MVRQVGAESLPVERLPEALKELHQRPLLDLVDVQAVGRQPVAALQIRCRQLLHRGPADDFLITENVNFVVVVSAEFRVGRGTGVVAVLRLVGMDLDAKERPDMDPVLLVFDPPVALVEILARAQPGPPGKPVVQ